MWWCVLLCHEDQCVLNFFLLSFILSWPHFPGRADDVIRERQRELAAMQSPGRVNGGQEVDGNEQMKTNKRLDFLDILLAAQVGIIATSLHRKA